MFMGRNNYQFLQVVERRFSEDSKMEAVSSNVLEGNVSSGGRNGRIFHGIQELPKGESPYKKVHGLYTGFASIQPIKRPQRVEGDMFPYVDGYTCEICRAITVQSVLSTDGFRYQNLAAAVVSGRDGCQICGLLIRKLDHALEDAGALKKPLILRIGNCRGIPYCQDEIWATLGRFAAILGIYTDEGRKSPKNAYLECLLTDEQGSSASQWIPGRR